MKSKVWRRIAALVMGITAAVSTQPYDVSAKDTTISVEDAIISLENGVTIDNADISNNSYKNTRYNNPISSQFYCADPTAVEYNGRLYLYGTNDHQQYEIAGADKDNTYEKIKSMLVFSTDDMTNWVYHGEINIGEIAPWIMNSWAPTVVSREEADGKTHFYMYFSNNGVGVGVITSTDPVGPWEDPLGKPLISTDTPGLTDCPNPFDPGAVIDENGVGWLSFGAGKASDGTDYMPGSNRIVRLGADMLSFDSEFAEIPAPYHFEASELNYINGTYVYTYNTDWSDHSAQWDYDCPVPSGCSMVYMTTKTPLDPTSWEMKGEFFQNPGAVGFDYSNNHTHLHKFNGNYYIFYHTLELKQGMGITGSYRSLCADTIHVDEATVTIEKTGGTKKGLNAVVPVSPYIENTAADLNNTADISYDFTNSTTPAVVADSCGAWYSVKGVEFTESENADIVVDPADFTSTAINSITYNIIVKQIDKSATLSMHPTTKAGTKCTGSVDISSTGNYSITCNMNDAEMLQNVGYFTISDDATVTFVVDTMVINDKYSFDLSVELTNTREWADGLKNIWNGLGDGDRIYISDYADFKYIADDDAIVFFASSVVGGDHSTAPVLDTPLTFAANVQGSGTVEVRLDCPTGELLSSVVFDSPMQAVTVVNNVVAEIGGTHDLYFVFSDEGIRMNAWRFVKDEGIDQPELLVGDVNCDGFVRVNDVILLNLFLSENKTAEISELGMLQAEADGIVGVNSNDAVAILKMIAGIVEE